MQAVGVGLSSPATKLAGLRQAAYLPRPPRQHHVAVCGALLSRESVPLSSSSNGKAQPLAAAGRPQVKAHASNDQQLGSNEDLGKDAVMLRRIGWISFWAQLALAVVSAVVIFFTLASNTKGLLPSIPVLFTLGGVVSSFISTFFAYGYTRVARRVIIDNEKVKVSNVVGQALANTRLNLIGLGVTLVGLQASVGQLVGKTLASSTSNPYAGAGSGLAQSTPTAIDVFSVQASTNTLMAHFISVFFANWLLRILNKGAQPAAPGLSGGRDNKGGSPQFQGIS
ncbi:hypothetical protein WJX73_002045 [Symbiochloris irregularis]|uniref:Uncharacterized protein n=1 Tax=Symbiochloris irregularis TaxID=706552 RepID=A0AAW1P0V5_9CHLO